MIDIYENLAAAGVHLPVNKGLAGEIPEQKPLGTSNDAP
jgi:hypothetical protein